MNAPADREGIEAIFERLKRAHADRDADAIAACYAPDAVIYGLAPPLELRGIDRDDIAAWLASWEGSIQLDARDLTLELTAELAWASALTRMRGRQNGKDQDMWYRTTMCFQKTRGA